MNKIEWSSWNVLEDEICDRYNHKTTFDDDNEDQVKADKILSFGMGPPHVHTPFGPVSVDNPLRPAMMWQCYIGNTNFRITYGIVDILMKIDGISAIKIMDRYSFCVGIAKLFEPKSVLAKINNILCPNNKPPIEVISIFSEVKNGIKDNKYWCIYIDKDHNVKHYAGDSKKKYEAQLNAFKIISNSQGGWVFSKEEYNEI